MVSQQKYIDILSVCIVELDPFVELVNVVAKTVLINEIGTLT